MVEPTARDLMTTDLLTITPDTRVMAIVRLLEDHGVSALPVMSAGGALLGLVTLADLTTRLSPQREEAPSWLRALFGNAEKSAERYARTHGSVAEEVMSTDFVTVSPDAPVSEIAATLERTGMRRALVMAQRRLVGMISRSDLLRAVTSPEFEPADLSDDRVRTAVMAAMRRQWWADPVNTQVEVHDGIVEFGGYTRGQEVRRALRVLAQHVPGVKGVRDCTKPMSLHAPVMF